MVLCAARAIVCVTKLAFAQWVTLKMHERVAKFEGKVSKCRKVVQNERGKKDFPIGSGVVFCAFSCKMNERGEYQ